jgi:heme-degrading monooxygenase HmoA
MAYYVITRTIIEDHSSKDDVLTMSKESAKIFRKQPGLIEMKSLIAENETHLTTYLVWEDQQSHLACMESKDFDEVTVQWTAFMKEGKIKFELETYHLIE